MVYVYCIYSAYLQYACNFNMYNVYITCEAQMYSYNWLSIMYSLYITRDA